MVSIGKDSTRCSEAMRFMDALSITSCEQRLEHYIWHENESYACKLADKRLFHLNSLVKKAHLESLRNVKDHVSHHSTRWNLLPFLYGSSASFPLSSLASCEDSS